MNILKTLTLTLAVLTMAGSVAFAQNMPNSNCPNGRCNASQLGYGSAWSRSNERLSTASPAAGSGAQRLSGTACQLVNFRPSGKSFGRSGRFL